MSTQIQTMWQQKLCTKAAVDLLESITELDRCNNYQSFNRRLETTVVGPLSHLLSQVIAVFLTEESKEYSFENVRDSLH
jgi:hypothetical protein